MQSISIMNIVSSNANFSASSLQTKTKRSVAIRCIMFFCMLITSVSVDAQSLHQDFKGFWIPEDFVSITSDSSLSEYDMVKLLFPIEGIVISKSAIDGWIYDYYGETLTDDRGDVLRNDPLGLIVKLYGIEPYYTGVKPIAYKGRNAYELIPLLGLTSDRVHTEGIISRYEKGVFYIKGGKLVLEVSGEDYNKEIIFVNELNGSMFPNSSINEALNFLDELTGEE